MVPETSKRVFSASPSSAIFGDDLVLGTRWVVREYISALRAFIRSVSPETSENLSYWGDWLFPEERSNPKFHRRLSHFHFLQSETSGELVAAEPSANGFVKLFLFQVWKDDLSDDPLEPQDGSWNCDGSSHGAEDSHDSPRRCSGQLPSGDPRSGIHFLGGLGLRVRCVAF